MRTRKARLPDAVRIHELIGEYARESILLPRTMAEICENIRDFTVAEQRGDVVGCAALHFYGLDLVEVRSVAVDRRRQHKGVGRRLVEALLKEAREHNVPSVCLFTRIPDYFARLGFVTVGHERLPEKILKDCLNCPRLNCCDETAMVYGSAAALKPASRAAAEALRLPLPVFRTFPG